MSNIFLITTSKKKAEDMLYTGKRIYQAAKKYFDVMLSDPRGMGYVFYYNQLFPLIYSQEKEISKILQFAYIIPIKNAEIPITTLTYLLKVYNWQFYDPFDGFVYCGAPKIFDAISLHKINLLPTSIISFSFNNVKHILKTESFQYPLIGKPVNGRHGKNITIIKNIEEALYYAQGHFTYHDSSPIFLQEYIHIKSEYRAIILNGNIIGTVQKKAPTDIITANAEQGAIFTSAQDPKIETLLQKFFSKKEGIIGVDIAISQDGLIYIFEVNYSPGWDAFEQATGIDVASQIVHLAVNKKRPNTSFR